MIEEEAIVLYSENNRIRFKPAGKSGCGGCMHQETCGTSVIAQLLPKREFDADHCEALQAGDSITVAIDETKLLLVSLLLYLAPLISMLATVIVANHLLPSDCVDQWLPAIALGALLFAFFLIHRLQPYLTGSFRCESKIINRTGRR